MAHSEFVKRLKFCYHRRQREQFVNGTLGPYWAERYPVLFDDRDVQIYQNALKTKKHFYEWLGAVLLYEATGYLSLVEKYWSQRHPRKLPIYEAIAPREVQELDGAGWPDLFCYSVDHTGWHFCEIKGATDELSDGQIRLFRKLHRISGKRICVLEIKELQL